MAVAAAGTEIPVTCGGTDPWPFILECQGWEFIRGKQDCCAFVAHVVKRVSGRDLMAEFPAYKTKRQAERIIMAHGGWAGMLDRVLAQIPVARRGDVVLMGDEIGICVGTAVAAFTKDAGLQYYPADTITGAWANG